MQGLIARNWRGLIKPKIVEIEPETQTDKYAKFELRPLERGFGVTLGNSLRRILLSSIQGAAVTAIKIEGVLHEFSSISGLKEDVTDIILNLKKLRLKLADVDHCVINLDLKGPKEIRGADIVANSNVEVLNPDLYIATLAPDSSFKAELYIAMGRGYVPSERSSVNHDIVALIPIDAIFSPVTRVNYSVTNARVGQATDYDRLVLEVWTDGSLIPHDAVAYAAKILRDHLALFLNFEEDEIEVEEVNDQAEFNDNLNRKVDELELSVRSANCLQNANIRYIGELVQKSESEMLRTKNFGRKSLNEIKEILTTMGFSLGMKIHNWSPPREEVVNKEE